MGSVVAGLVSLILVAGLAGAAELGWVIGEALSLSGLRNGEGSGRVEQARLLTGSALLDTLWPENVAHHLPIPGQ
jgi:hypothetical protein